jgi:hypothetical protein
MKHFQLRGFEPRHSALADDFRTSLLGGSARQLESSGLLVQSRFYASNGAP